MDFDAFKALPENQVLAEAAKLAGVDASVMDGIWRTESGRGANMRSPAGARGHFQLMPETQASLEKRFGRKINPDDFHESAFAAAELVRENLAKFGNLPDALRAYNGSWDKSKWDNPETQAYPGKVLGAQADTAAAYTKARNKHRAIAAAPLFADPRFVDQDKELGRLADEFIAEAQDRESTTMLDKARAAFMTQGMFSAILTTAARPDFRDDPDHRMTPEKAAGLTADEIERLASAHSAEEEDYELAAIMRDREEVATLGRHGVLPALGASLIAGIPEAIISGKLFALPFRATAAARAASTAARVGRSVTENVVGNVLSTAVEDALTYRVSAMDYPVSAAMGLIGVAADVPGIRAAGKVSAMQADRERALLAINEAVGRKAEFDRQAVANLGPGAAPSAIAAEAVRLETDALRTAVRSAEFPETRALFPDIDKLIRDEELAETAVIRGDAPGALSVGLSDRELLARTLDLPAGVHMAADAPAWGAPAVDTIQRLSRLVPDAKIMVRFGTELSSVQGSLIAAAGKDGYIITLNPNVNGIKGSVTTAVHEFGHLLDFAYLGKAGDDLQAGVHDAWKRFVGSVSSDPKTAAGLRVSATKREPGDTMAELFSDPKGVYATSKAEFIAEQFVKFMQEDALASNRLGLGERALELVKQWVRKVIDLFAAAKEEAFLPPEEELRDFFNAILERRIQPGPADPRFSDRSAVPGAGGGSGSRAIERGPDLSFLQDPVAIKYGLSRLPVNTAAARAEIRAMIALYKEAEVPAAPWNNIPAERISVLNNAPALGSTGLNMLTSENPILRMFAYKTLESTTGAGTRGATASMSKYLAEQRMMGNTIPDLRATYAMWRQANGGSIREDFFGGEKWREFNSRVSEEIERRRTSSDAGPDPLINRAADVAEAAFDRIRLEQIRAKTLGWAGLPDTSRGYLPHTLRPDKLRNATAAQKSALHGALIDQFIMVEGWDFTFSANLAAKYMDRVNNKAVGGFDSTVNRTSSAAAELIEDALRATGMSEDEVRENLKRYLRGGPGYTKGRIELDLLKTYDDPETGQQFRLLDLFDSDVLGMIRQQARRASGEVALSQFGIFGQVGLKLLRRAASMGEAGAVAQPAELEALDQVSAEFLGQPFGNHQSKFMDRAMTVNSLVRLGGMLWTQTAELYNSVVHLGLRNTAAIIPALPRLRAEAAALAKGKKVDSILTSLETSGLGGEFGTGAYKMAFPFDNPHGEYEVYGQDSANAFDRLTRGGSMAQGILSGWRAMHAAQVRGVAEQIVLKSLRYIKEGGNDVALNDMGFDAELRGALAERLSSIAEFGPDGRVVSFDIQGLGDPELAQRYIHAVHRGAGQIIQQTFIGETGKWAHDGWLRLMAQFRTFSLTSMEKQWTRQRANHGTLTATMMLLGTISAGAPIYMARVYADSLFREDQDEYLERRLSWEAVARGAMNYSAMTGLAPDILDMMSSVAGYSTTGGRIGSGSDFIGSAVAPALGLVDQAYKAVQNTADGTDLSELARVLPMNKLPGVAQAVNALVN